MTKPPFSPRTSLSRREATGLMSAFVAALITPGTALAAPAGRFGPATPFSWDRLVARAQANARRPFMERPASKLAVPDFDTHVRLTYGQAEELPGHVRLLPTRTGIAPQAVGISIVENGQSRTLTDMKGLFGGGADGEAAGFRVMWADGHADWLAFLGGSYFRAAGSHDQFGLSARGISINTGAPGPEEFPEFTDFWFEGKGEDGLIVHALLDGPSLTGAYRIETTRTPEAGIQDVTATLFLRRDIQRLGIAPMTSMYLYGEGDRRADWRPEVHDSDGLAIVTGTGEHIWHPLINPEQEHKPPITNAMRADHVKGFGLLQRDQNFDHYQDDMSYYHRRPSLWVEPRGDWGPGTVELYSFASISETVDNVCAYWLSDTPAKAGQRRDLAYRLTWSSQEPAHGNNALCTAFRVGPGGVPGQDEIKGVTRYVFDFEGEVLAGLTRDSHVEAQTDIPAKAVLLMSVGPVGGQKNIWRVTMDVRHADLPHPEFRLFLKRAGGALSETVIATAKLP